MKSRTVIAGFIPVIHRAYLEILERHPLGSIALFDNSILKQFDYLRKDIRALKPQHTQAILEKYGRDVSLINETELNQLILDKNVKLVLFNDDISRYFTAKIEASPNILFESVFLRWDKDNVLQTNEVFQPKTIDFRKLPPGLIDALYQEAFLSSDWWRHVAAGTYHEKKLLLSHNSALPHEHAVSIDGDPRATTKQGADIERSIFIHGEAALIAKLAKKGIPTENKEIYVTTFPCAYCARLIAASGFSTCYFIEGYANLDGQHILESAGVDIIKIEGIIPPKPDKSRLRLYPKSSNR